LEIELHSTTLMGSVKGIIELNIDFRSIEGTISRVEFPLFTESIESFFKGLFSKVPLFNFSQVFFRAS